LERAEFTNEPKVEYDTTSVGIGVGYRPLAALEVLFSVGREERDSDEAEREYTDNMAILNLTYRVF
jgi:hypothetical protein